MLYSVHSPRYQVRKSILLVRHYGLQRMCKAFLTAASPQKRNKCAPWPAFLTECVRLTLALQER